MPFLHHIHEQRGGFLHLNTCCIFSVLNSTFLAPDVYKLLIRCNGVFFSFFLISCHSRFCSSLLLPAPVFRLHAFKNRCFVIILFNVYFPEVNEIVLDFLTESMTKVYIFDFVTASMSKGRHYDLKQF